MNQQFRNKAEAQQAATELEAKAARWRERQEEVSGPQYCGFMAAGYRADAEQAEEEAARIRALLSNLPE